MNDQSTPQRIVVLGAGYTGMLAAIRVARRTRRMKATVTLVNPTPRFTERLRMHQLATAQSLPDLQIPDMLEGTGVVFVQGWAAALHPDAGTVEVSTPAGTIVLGFDRLIYAIGSVTDTTAVAGVDGDAFTLNGPAAAAALAARLDSLEAGSSVVVCGNGLTGVETVAEIAESHPHLRTVLVGRGEPGAMMGPKAQAYLRAALDRLGV
jgi:NADH dehydrogenase FAD-containing subunit